jgi:hypothetical protein
MWPGIDDTLMWSWAAGIVGRRCLIAYTLNHMITKWWSDIRDTEISAGFYRATFLMLLLRNVLSFDNVHVIRLKVYLVAQVCTWHSAAEWIHYLWITDSKSVESQMLCFLREPANLGLVLPEARYAHWFINLDHIIVNILCSSVLQVQKLLLTWWRVYQTRGSFYPPPCSTIGRCRW